MGQNLEAMNKPRPRAELLYDLVSTGNIVAIKALCEEGVSLEWADREGKTPLIVACMNRELFNVAKTLIELGANVNAYSPGRHAGTPLHHAAKRGFAQSVKLLLSHGANALLRDDDSQTPLDVARINGHTSVVREIEKTICYFSGWLREFYGPGFLEALTPQLLSREIWVVVIPLGSSNSTMPRKMELFIYPDLQKARPRTVIALWKAKIEEPKFQQKDPALIIFDQPTRTRNTLTSPLEGDKQQLQQLYNACIGIPQVTPPPVPTQTSTPEIAPQTEESGTYNGWGVPDSGPVCNPTKHAQTSDNISPSAPPIPEDLDGASVTNDMKDKGSSSSCAICFEAPIEGACIPCGHMAGCMACLNEIKAKKGDCPVCRGKINQVVRLYAV
nr:putative E3 ubiquitin-protein ligase XBAT35 [Quercus suber]XP_023907519.1 putative E3 ubiquitin-protein ligase XBAT35 [Quercus suber]XP_023907520.1 putative E3 ubiquitin-protein ligase XBAT35 [Quercus suber]POF16970.1 isoform 2 of putative e3 ubiquitin-protein ligase xbat35 [Quercus suber]